MSDSLTHTYTYPYNKRANIRARTSCGRLYIGLLADKTDSGLFRHFLVRCKSLGARCSPYNSLSRICPRRRRRTKSQKVLFFSAFRLSVYLYVAYWNTLYLSPSFCNACTQQICTPTRYSDGGEVEWCSDAYRDFPFLPTSESCFLQESCYGWYAPGRLLRMRGAVAGVKSGFKWHGAYMPWLHCAAYWFQIACIREQIQVKGMELLLVIFELFRTSISEYLLFEISFDHKIRQ